MLDDSGGLVPLSVIRIEILDGHVVNIIEHLGPRWALGLGATSGFGAAALVAVITLKVRNTH